MRSKRKKSKFKPRRCHQRIQNDARPSGIDSKPVEANPRPPPTPYYTKAEVLAFVGRTWPRLWRWIREGRFPKPRTLGGRPIWIAAEVDLWFAALPVRNYKQLETETEDAA